MRFVIQASMSDGLEEGDYLDTDFAIGDVVTVWEGSGEDGWAQLTYQLLRTGPDGEELAFWSASLARWCFQDAPNVPERLRLKTVSDLTLSAY